MTDPVRSRTYSWDDPMITAAGSRSMSGLNFLRAMIAGEYPPPPIARMLGMYLTEIEAGRAVFTITPREDMYNPIGVVHGGIAMTILDSAMGCAVMSMLPEGLAYTTVDANIHLTRAISFQTGELRAIAESVHTGRRLATAQAKLVDAAGKLYAHATTTCMVFPIEAP